VINIRATIKDVAREAGVSVSTVSYALNRKGEAIKESHRRVHEAAERLGYVPDATARSLVHSRTNSIGLIIPSELSSERQNPYFVSVIATFSEELTKRKNWLSIYLDNGSDKDSLNQLIIDAKVDGIVFMSPKVLESVQKIMNRRGLPYVHIMSGNYPKKGSAVIVIDGESGIEKAMKYLVDLGHKRILCLSGSQYDSRHRRYISEVEKLGLEYDRNICAHYSDEAAYNEMASLLASGEDLPTAVLATNDLMALGAMKAVKDAGFKIPEDMSFIGFDDISAAKSFDPPLTTIKQQLKEVAEVACDFLFECRDKKQMLEIDRRIETRFVERKSVTIPKE
jgi:DNA-binding LacI/PurR family transcriptional regulator